MVSAKRCSPEELLAQFDRYLVEVRGARPGTREHYQRHVREFLEARFPSGSVEPCKISPRDLFCYIAKDAAGAQLSRTKLAATALRSFLRYLAVRGDCDPALAASVPSVPKWKKMNLPKVLSEEQVSALLKAFDLATATGLRDYAITLCLARLGLRAGEVAHLLLDDVNWRSGSLRISAEKGRRVSTLPLPGDVGAALAAYLRSGRPPTKERNLFVNHGWGPRKGTAMTSYAVRAVVRRAWERSGVQVPSQGTHTLRHTLASRMLHTGADLKQIADVLRHRSLDTTLVYAKVDLERLTEVAQPWPEATT